MTNRLTMSQHWNEHLNTVMDNLYNIFEVGAIKHGLGSWLDDDNPSMLHKANCASMFRHLAAHTTEPGLIDNDSGLPHLYHLLARTLMRLAKDEELKARYRET